MIGLFRRLFGLLSVDHPSPSLKQSPTVVALAVSLLLIVSVPDLNVTNPVRLFVGIGMILAATAIAAYMTRHPELERWVVLVPVIDVFAVGAFRVGTGGSTSIFTGMMILPLLWIAAEKSRWHIALAAISSSMALLLPYAFGTLVLHSAGELIRGFYSPLVFAFMAAVVNELARQARVQLGAVKALAEERAETLSRTMEYAAQLEEGEARLRAADRMFRGLWSAVTEQAVIGTDETGLIDAWNPGATKMLGISRREAEGRRYVFDFHVAQELEDRARELNYPPGATVLNPGFSALVESARLGSAESREWDYVREDGTILPVSLSVTARTDEEGEIIGYLFVAHDVTKEREVARLKDEFVGLISHELRTPLSSILGYLELLRDEDDNPLSPEQLQYLGVAERNAHRLLRLVGDLLFTAQVESGKFPLDLTEVPLASIVTAAIESAGPTAAAAGVSLVDELPEGSVVVIGDPVRLGQSCDNLISNALKFTPRGGSVSVSLTATPTEALITVRDTGLGIAASELDQLFSRFFRATTATRNAVPGVGLGLTITKAIVTAHQGRMEVESEEGVGTCFTIRLPLAPVGAGALR